jgi:imidazolonepropionase-like amidohydrolase
VRYLATHPFAAMPRNAPESQVICIFNRTVNLIGFISARPWRYVPHLCFLVCMNALVSCAHVDDEVVSRQSASPPGVTSDLAIVGVTLIDMTGAVPKDDMTIVVSGSRIVAVAPAGSISLGAHVRQISGRGRYLIPGLWDMHTHAAEFASLWLPVMLANGITGIRNMHAVSLVLTKRLAADTASGEIPGPRVVANGQLIDGAGSAWPTAIIVRDATEARATVDMLSAQGADFLKVYSFLSRGSYFAIADEARRAGIPFAGHVPQAISALEASNAGQRSIEHLDGVLMAAAVDERELRDRFADASLAWRNPTTSTQGRSAMALVNRDLVEHFDESKASVLFAAFVRNDTYQTPTLVAHYTNINRAEPDFTRSPALEYVPRSVRAAWLALAPPNEALRLSLEAQLNKYLEVVRAMDRAGVPLLAGTDTGGAFIVPGDSLHRELELMVRAGLSPMKALQSATSAPARFLHEEKEGGTIEVGKRADLVLLDGNPLSDISNTRRIRAVIRNGRLFDRTELDVLLVRAKEDAETKLRLSTRRSVGSHGSTNSAHACGGTPGVHEPGTDLASVDCLWLGRCADIHKTWETQCRVFSAGVVAALSTCAPF